MSGVRAALVGAVRRRPGQLAGLVGWSLVEAVPALLWGQAVARAVDDGFLAGRIGTGLLWLVPLAVATPVSALAARNVLLRVAGIVEPFRDELVGGVVEGCVARSVRFGAAPDEAGVARLTRQVEMVRDSLAGVIMVTRGFVVQTGAALAGLAVLAPELLIFVLPPLLAGLGAYGLLLVAMARVQHRAVLAEERVADTTARLAGALRDIAGCGARDRAEAEAGVRIAEQARAGRTLAWLAGARTLCVAVGGWLPLGLLLVAAPWLRGRGVSAGALLGAVTYVLQVLVPAVETLMQGFGATGMRLIVPLRRLLQTTEPLPPSAESERREEGRRGATAGRPSAESESGRDGGRRGGVGVRLRGVSFGYGGAARAVVEGFDLELAPGERLAVVGPSGIGKSTLAALIAGMLTPGRGEVLLDGEPVSALTPAELAARRVVLPQEAYVFPGTLAENLCWPGPPRPRRELLAAVAAVGLAPHVDGITDADGLIAPEEMSAGQRQLVALARAHLAGAPLTVLDEATCHLDPAAADRAEMAFAARTGTLVIVAHRLGSAARTDRVLVMDGSRPLCGTHDTLLIESSLYRALSGHHTAGVG
ncbi:MAG: ATP-binding cassette domain-containing protein [Streptosporangiales bacterium]|nr:ATP-binding cassette domain-containing protein [Streptosporangiales bacterium]